MIYTIGHSDYSSVEFIEILRLQGIELVVDIRSEPYSRRVQRFNKKAIEKVLNNSGIGYIWRGKSLGGLENLSEKDLDDSLNELIELAEDIGLAIMCSERNYAKCHRHHLIAKRLVQKGVSVMHISGENQIKVSESDFTDQKDLF